MDRFQEYELCLLCNKYHSIMEFCIIKDGPDDMSVAKEEAEHEED